MKRLRELRLQEKKTQTQIAEKLGVAQQTYATYEIDTRVPPIDVLEKLADYYNVSVDYLLGRTNDKKGVVLEGVYFRLASEAQELGVPPEDMQQIIELYKKYTNREI